MRSESTLEATRVEGAYPTIDAPVFSQHGGFVETGGEVSISAAAGTLFYTLDGSDVRLPGGGVSPAAQPYLNEISIDFSTEVLTRALSGGQWSAATKATFLVESPPALVITEMMYHPLEPSPEEIAAGFTDDDDFEFIELQNQGDRTLALSGVSFVDGIDFSFTDSDVTTLAPGEFVVLVSNRAAFEFRYGIGVNIAGEYIGRLNNGGEHVVLAGSFGEPIVNLIFDDYDEFRLTDGGGFSKLFDWRSSGGRSILFRLPRS